MRGVGAAHVERAEELRFEEAALDRVARPGEDGLDHRGQLQEGVVVVHREEPLGGIEPRSGALLGVVVAHHGEELHRRGVAPPGADVDRRELHAEGDGQRPEHSQRGAAGPLRRPVAQLEAVALGAAREQARRTAEEERPLPLDVDAARGEVEGARTLRRIGVAQQAGVARRAGQQQLHGGALAGGRRVGKRRGIESGAELRRTVQVAGLVIDTDFGTHSATSLRVGRIATSSAS